MHTDSNMKKFFNISFLLVLLAVALFSCKRDGSLAPDMGYNYFPDKVGTYVVYNVDSIYYTSELADTFKFQIKEKIESVFNDIQGRPTMRIERYIKYYNDTIPYSAMNWTLRDVWAANRTATTAEKVEENERFIKLAFPVKKNQSWDGNAQNTYGQWNYTYSYYDLPRTINSVVYDSVLEVKQKDDLTLINKRYYIERYARNVGMVYKQVIDVESQPNGIHPDSTNLLAQFYSQPILQRVDDGVILTMYVVEHGTE